MLLLLSFFIFLFIHPAPSVIYTLSLHDALPILMLSSSAVPQMMLSPSSVPQMMLSPASVPQMMLSPSDRKSTRLNSSHVSISYAVFCLKKKKTSANIRNLSRHDRVLFVSFYLIC